MDEIVITLSLRNSKPRIHVIPLFVTCCYIMNNPKYATLCIICLWGQTFGHGVTDSSGQQLCYGIQNDQIFVYIRGTGFKRLKVYFVVLQLKSNPSENEEKEAQSQLVKSDEMQRLRSQALDAFQSAHYTAAITFLDKILEVSLLNLVAEASGTAFGIRLVYILPGPWAFSSSGLAMYICR